MYVEPCMYGTTKPCTPVDPPFKYPNTNDASLILRRRTRHLSASKVFKFSVSSLSFLAICNSCILADVFLTLDFSLGRDNFGGAIWQRF